MIYLDYAANSPVEEEVLKTYIEANRKFIANPNSKHDLGIQAKEAIENSTKNIKKLLNLNNSKVIYTSGASEANNLAIKGICQKYKNGHIIISPLEHSSVVAPVNYLQSKCFDIDIVNLDKSGRVDLEHLKSLLRDDTILVSIASVDSEIGIIQPIDEINELIKKYPNCTFHTDSSQAIGKTNINFDAIDMFTIAPHKFNGLNGFGALIIKNGIKLIPQINGGMSTTEFRSGTPDVANIIAMEKALELTLINKDKNDKYLSDLKKYIINKLSTINNIYINSNEYSINSTINFSILKTDSNFIASKLNEKEIYVSTKSACSNSNAPSKLVLAVTNDIKKASSSIRISYSTKTSYDEIDTFIDELKKILEK